MFYKPIAWLGYASKQKQCNCELHGHSSENNLTAVTSDRFCCHKLFISDQHWWFSGRILACHAGGPGSIPGQCKSFFWRFHFSKPLTAYRLSHFHLALTKLWRPVLIVSFLKLKLSTWSYSYCKEIKQVTELVCRLQRTGTTF